MRRHGLAYTAGVLAAFARARRRCSSACAPPAPQVGWGFQLQSPVVVAVLAYVLFAVGLNLSGVFHLGGSLQGARASAPGAARPGLAGSFFTGVLAAVVATPCTAPFMATAIGFALTQPAGVALTVMLALGLGLALPFLALTLAPAADRPPAAAGRLDGDAEAGAGLPGLRHGGLAGLGAGASRSARPACSPR